MKKITIVFLGLFLTLFLFNSPIWGQEPIDEALLARVSLIDSIPHPDTFKVVFSPNDVTVCTPSSNYDWVKVYNQTDSTLIVKNTQNPVGTTTFSDQTLVPGAHFTYQFQRPQMNGVWVFSVTKGSYTRTLTVHVSCTQPTPTLTQWGIIILVALIIVTGVYLWMRRKPVTA